MSSSYEAIRQRATSRAAVCEGKKTFTSRVLAWEVAKRMKSRRRIVYPYKCPYCTNYHLGSKSR